MSKYQNDWKMLKSAVCSTRTPAILTALARYCLASCSTESYDFHRLSVSQMNLMYSFLRNRCISTNLFVYFKRFVNLNRVNFSNSDNKSKQREKNYKVTDFRPQFLRYLFEMLLNKYETFTKLPMADRVSRLD